MMKYNGDFNNYTVWLNNGNNFKNKYQKKNSHTKKSNGWKNNKNITIIWMRHNDCV